MIASLGRAGGRVGGFGWGDMGVCVHMHIEVYMCQVVKYINIYGLFTCAACVFTMLPRLKSLKNTIYYLVSTSLTVCKEVCKCLECLFFPLW